MIAIHDFLYTSIPSLLSNKSPLYIEFIRHIVVVIGMLLVSVFTYYISKFAILKIIRHIFKSSNSRFLHIIANNKTLNSIPYASAFFVVIITVKCISMGGDSILEQFLFIVYELCLLSIFIIFMLFLGRVIWSLNDYYEAKFRFAKRYPIVTYLKVLTLIEWAIGTILIVAFFAHTSVLALLTGLGAASAVVLLIFKDTLLGIMSSIQVTVSNLIKIGDDIAIGQYNLKGRVVDIAINSVKIKNQDNTTTIIPTYMLTSEMVVNSRTMIDSGARLIKKSLVIDSSSVTACSKDLLDCLSTRFDYIKDYLLKCNNKDLVVNLALYRHYIAKYLCSHKQIHKNNKYNVLVYDLDAIVGGIPLEINAFSTQTGKTEYEALQSEIIEHCIAVMPLFALTLLKS